MQVEQVDFVSVPTRDSARAVAWYRDVLGLPVSEYTDGEVETPNVTLSFWNPRSRARSSCRTRTGSRCGSPTSRPRSRRLRGRGAEVIGDPGLGRLPHGLRQGSRRQRPDPPPEVQASWIGPQLPRATPSCRCRRRRTSTGASPTSGLRPGLLRPQRPGPGPGTETGLPETMLDVDVAGLAVVGEGGISIVRAPDGGSRSSRSRTTSGSASSSGRTRSSRPTTPPSWEHGLLVVVPKGVELEQPLAVRIVNSVEGGALFFRLLVIAEPESRFSLIEEYASSSPELARLHERRRPSSSSSRPRSSSTSRSRTSRGRPGTSPRTTRASSATPSSTGSPAASARRRARSGSRTTWPARARPRA